MSLTLIILLITAGLALLLIEMLFIPGFGITGIAGLLIIISGIIVGYNVAGQQTGHYILIGTIVATLVLTYYSLRTKTWKNTGLKASIDSRIIAFEQDIPQGTQGKTVSRLAPSGKVLINGMAYEAHAENDFLDENTEIIVIKTIQNKIIVKQLN